jgi:ribose 5-phosphate isomerase RpiB
MLNPLPMGAVCAWTGVGMIIGVTTLHTVIAIAVTIAERFAERPRRHVNNLNFDLLMISSQPESALPPVDTPPPNRFDFGH